MSNLYRRTTRTLALADAPAPLREAAARHAEAHQVALAGARAWLTHSVNPPSETFFGKLLGRRANPVDPDAEHDTLVVLTATHLVIAGHGARRGTFALGLPLVAASVSRQSPLAAKLGAAAPDVDGMMISGLPGEHGSSGSYFVGLDDGPDGKACYAATDAAIRAAKA